ncbi:MAG: hypothetical protein IT234_06715 [Bacteroidia bacterium]|nr:hypothetical protein [Bacteroidia bacterium]
MSNKINNINTDICKNCKTSLYKIIAKKLCQKCYNIHSKCLKIDNLKTNDFEREKIKHATISELQDLKQMDISKQKEFIKNKINAKLSHIKLYGEIENNRKDVSILLLENIFNEISTKITKNRTLYTSDLMYFDTRFNKEQRKIIALKLLKLFI